MTDHADSKKGGFHFGNVGGNVKLTAGADIVAGDKTTASTITRGFRAEGEKQQFQVQIDQLREALREVKTEIEATSSLGDDQKEDAVAEILQHVRALKDVQDRTAELAVGKQAPADLGSLVETTLHRAGGIIDRLQNVAKATSEVAGKVSEFGMKYGPLLLNARHLFGLP